jgi:uncharacterized protein (TIGR02611 family)
VRNLEAEAGAHVAGGRDPAAEAAREQAAGDLRPEEIPEPVRRLRRQRQRFRQRGPIYRGAFVTAGFIVLLAGLVMLVLPGPAFLVIPIGLAMLSLQFAWAGKLLDRALIYAKKAQVQAAETSGRQKVLVTLAVVCAVAAAAALVVILL